MKKIKLFDPFVTTKENNYLKNAFKSKSWASGAGTNYVNMFERKFQKYVKAKSCVTVNSGTAALHLALSTANIKNKEVLLPSLSFVSTAHAVVYNGGKVTFVDVDPNTLCIDPQEIEKKINRNTQVILPVHFAGFSADLNKLRNLADEKILLIEDAAHAAGSSFNGKKIGSHGDLVCFSFHPVKNLAMPTGGLISINNQEHQKIRKSLLSRRWCGITDRQDDYYDVKELGWNFYMNELSAAVGLGQLEMLDKMNSKRRHIAKRYHNEINLERKMPYHKDCSYHFYWIITKNREEFRKKLKSVGIETGTHYRPTHTMTFYKNIKAKLPVTEEIGKQIISLPTHPNLTENDVDLIIDSINKFSS